MIKIDHPLHNATNLLIYIHIHYLHSSRSRRKMEVIIVVMTVKEENVLSFTLSYISWTLPALNERRGQVLLEHASKRVSGLIKVSSHLVK